MLKHFLLYYKKYCRKLLETFRERFIMHSLENFTKCFDKFVATFIEIFHASFLLRYLKHYTKCYRNFSAKFLEIWRSQLLNYWTDISTTLQKYFMKDYKKCCVNIPTIMTQKYTETVLKYFLCGLDRRHKHFTKCLGKFRATFIKIFHASFVLTYLKRYTQNLADSFLQSFSKYS